MYVGLPHNLLRSSHWAPESARKLRIVLPKEGTSQLKCGAGKVAAHQRWRA